VNFASSRQAVADERRPDFASVTFIQFERMKFALARNLKQDCDRIALQGDAPMLSKAALSQRVKNGERQWRILRSYDLLLSCSSRHCSHSPFRHFIDGVLPCHSSKIDYTLNAGDENEHQSSMRRPHRHRVNDVSANSKAALGCLESTCRVELKEHGGKFKSAEAQILASSRRKASPLW
jgi:hypothetical protein